MKHLLLLHGALGSSAQFNEIKVQLADHVVCHTPDFFGHGKLADSRDDFSIEGFAHQIHDYCNKMKLDEVAVFGYSMGGYVALCLARHQPDLVSSIVTLGTKFDWTSEHAAREIQRLDPFKMEQKVPEFITELKELHGEENWKNIVEKTARMLKEMGEQPVLQESDLALIRNPVLLMLGDEDTMVSTKETEWAAEHLANASVQMLPETPHPFNKVESDKLVKPLLKFISQPTAG